MICASAFVLSFILTWVLLPVLSARAADVPNERSSHHRATPRGGGIGFITAFLAVCLYRGEGAAPILLLPLAAVGFIDDIRGLPALPRLAVHVITAIVATVWFGNPGESMPAVLWSAVVIVALINFYNFLDGIDGLVAGCTFVQLAFIAGRLPEAGCLAAALGAFLVFNWSPAKVFMGDVGSTFLGAYIGLAAIRAPAPNFGLWVVAMTIPLTLDGAVTIVRRVLRGENPMRAHRSHLYQRLAAKAGHARVSLFYGSGTVLIGLLITVLSPVFGLVSAITIGVAIIVLGELHAVRLPNGSASAEGPGAGRQES